MNKKTLVSIGCAIVFGLIAVLLVHQYIKIKEEEISRPLGEMIDVVVVTQDVKAGSTITENILGMRTIPKYYARGNSVHPSDASRIIGQKLRIHLKAKDPILWTDLLESSDDDVQGSLIASKIPKNQRALSISVDQVSSISGMIRPNDHVDILCSLRDESSGEEATITLLQNITIIATGSNIFHNVSSGNYGNVTLLVTSEEAEIIVFAQKRGALTLLLRNPGDINTRKDMKAVKFSDVYKNETLRKIQTKRDIEIIKPGR